MKNLFLVVLVALGVSCTKVEPESTFQVKNQTEVIDLLEVEVYSYVNNQVQDKITLADVEAGGSSLTIKAPELAEELELTFKVENGGFTSQRVKKVPRDKVIKGGLTVIYISEQTRIEE